MTRSNRSSSWMRHPSRLEVAIELAGRKKLAGKPLTADEEALLARAGGARPRARPTRHEAADAEHVAQVASTRWWGPGLYRHEQSEGNWRQGVQQMREGQQPGWPDFTLWVPAVGTKSHWGPPVRAALELKREALRPAGKLADEWWLIPYHDERWGRLRGAYEHHGLKVHQARTLQLLHACGLRTMVAYGAEEALAWLDEVAGPRPERLPEGW